MGIQDRAERLAQHIQHVGGPVDAFETVGRLQLAVCLKEGLYPDSKVLDIGCGCLRGGYWLIHFLNAGCYCGIEPNREVLAAGIEHILEPDLVETKRPRFDQNTSFDAAAFGDTFDFYVARSIWTHASKADMVVMLDSFIKHSTKDAVFLTSYCRAGLLRGRDYLGDAGVGMCPPGKPSMVHHRFGWIVAQCQDRGLAVREIREREYNHGMQTWLRITRQ